MDKPKFGVAVVMQRRTIQNRWQSEVWEPVGVFEDTATGAPRLLSESEGVVQWLHVGLSLELRRDEAEGYFLNVSTPRPGVFVMWRLADGQGVPAAVTASYSEASAMMDSGEQVDQVPMAPELFDAVCAFVRANYKPETKRRVRPQSFKHPKERAQS